MASENDTLTKCRGLISGEFDEEQTVKDLVVARKNQTAVKKISECKANKENLEPNKRLIPSTAKLSFQTCEILHLELSLLFCSLVHTNKTKMAYEFCAKSFSFSFCIEKWF